jgi:hypothetical protein
MMKVLVTGSRDWLDEALVENSLSEVAAEFGKFLLVQGDCPTGADAIAKAWAIRSNYPHKDFLADWDSPCGDDCCHVRYRRNGDGYYSCAGHVRNQKMADFGAELCLAFPLGKSPGTRGMMRIAKKAGIEVINLGDE